MPGPNGGWLLAAAPGEGEEGAARFVLLLAASRTHRVGLGLEVRDRRQRPTVLPSGPRALQRIAVERTSSVRA